MSATVSLCDDELPCWTPPILMVPGMTKSILEPMLAIWSWMLFFDPWPIASIVITDATPIIIPSIVRNERILLRFNALIATFKRFRGFISLFF